MAGAPLVSTIPDPSTQRVVRDLLNRITALEASVRALQATALPSSLSAGGQRLQNVATPQNASDAVNLSTLNAKIAATLETFKGQNGVNGTIDTTGTQIITVKNGIIVSIT